MPARAADFAATNEAPLRAALTNAVAGDTITSHNSITAAGGGGLPAITQSINGNGFALDGNGQNRGFLAYTGTSTIQNLTIQNTVAQGGAGAAQAKAGFELSLRPATIIDAASAASSATPTSFTAARAGSRCCSEANRYDRYGTRPHSRADDEIDLHPA